MKRLIATPLWFYTGWTAGALADYVAGMFGVTVGPLFGPILGIAAAVLFAGDPRRAIWSRVGVPAPSPERTQQLA